MLESISAKMQPTDHTSTNIKENHGINMSLQHNTVRNPTSFEICFRIEHDFWGPVPACGHIFCQGTLVIMSRISNASKSKVTDLQ